MRLEAGEFIRRFLLHILPTGFCKIRYYGIFANRNRQASMTLCRKVLSVKDSPPVQASLSWQELLLTLTGVDPRVCPVCRKGRMQSRGGFPPAREPPVAVCSLLA